MTMKRGKKANWATHPETGEIEEGLYVSKYSDGRVKAYYYKDKENKHITCGSEFFIAQQKFAQYKNNSAIIVESSAIKTLTLVIDGETNADHMIGALNYIADKNITINDIDITDEFWNRAECIIKNNFLYAAKRLNIPQLAYITDVTPPVKSITLIELSDLYKDNYEGDSKTNLRRILKFFTEFTKVIGIQSVREINFEDISKYEKMLQKEKHRETVNNQYRFVKNRIDAVKSVVRKGMRRISVKDDCIKLLQNIDQLTYVKKKQEKILINKRDRRSLAKEELKNLLECSESDLLVKCGILMGLNACIRWGDFARLEPYMFDFDKQEFNGWRDKNGIPQAAMLWDETASALREYMSNNKLVNNLIFTTRFGNPFVNKYLRIKFNKIRKKANLEWLTQKQLRKFSATVASDLGHGSKTDEYMCLMGREIGGSEASYVIPNAQKTAEVVSKMHGYYFGK